ncbi:MAG: cystathionine beta-lyase [Bauldia sp.]|nr:cystathionine beta-lyase [Bauldia sp.]
MSKSGDSEGRPRKLATRLVRAGRDKSLTGQFVNPPVVHASTVLFDSVDDMVHRRQRYQYGRRGTPTSEALESAVNELEGAEGTILCPSGLAAAATALLSCVSAGDRILLVDSVYAPVRHFADTVLKRLGVETVYYDPLIGAGIEMLFEARTTAVYLEAPGSLTFEMQDLAAIAGVAKRYGATVLFDNTWATPAYFRPLEHGADLSIMAGTKYLAGHSDVMLGTVAANGPALKKLKDVHGAMGVHVGPDDMYLGLRGIRTLPIRLERHWQSAMIVTAWLAARPEVARVLYPPLEADPGHRLWKRDMTGASGLFGIVLYGWSEDQAKRFVDGLELFGIGASWGGFESLAILAHPKPVRTATAWQAEGPLLRLHIGLEDPGDLIADLEAGFARVTAA